MEQAVTPLQPQLLPDFRRPFHMAGIHIQHTAQPHHQVGPRLRAVLGHPPLLLGRPQADKDHVRPGGPNLVHHRAVRLEVSVMGAAEEKVRVPLFQIFPRLLRHAGLGPQQKQAQPVPGQSLHQGGGEVDPWHPPLQGGPQNLRRVDHADPVRQNQAGSVENLPIRLRLTGHRYNFRVGGYHIGKARPCRQCLPGGHRLFQGDIVKGHPHNFFSHRFASPLSYFPARGRELHIIRVIVTRIHPFVHH